jgi:hypothetical protein
MANDTKELLFAEHLKYELEMFDEAARFLDSPQFAALDRTKRDQWFRYNSAIEAFWIHARLLIEFLSNPQKSLDFSGNHASARDCADKYQYDQHLKWAYDKINEQVAHFNYRRKSKEYEKLNQDNIKAVKGALNKEIRSFLDVLDDEWKEEPRKVTPELVVFLASNNVASTSSVFSSVNLIIPARRR